ncbi:unnamed protein product, partial [Musa hybrid cultivar]
TLASLPSHTRDFLWLLLQRSSTKSSKGVRKSFFANHRFFDVLKSNRLSV